MFPLRMHLVSNGIACVDTVLLTLAVYQHIGALSVRAQEYSLAVYLGLGGPWELVDSFEELFNPISTVWHGFAGMRLGHRVLGDALCW